MQKPLSDGNPRIAHTVAKEYVNGIFGTVTVLTNKLARDTNSVPRLIAKSIGDGGLSIRKYFELGISKTSKRYERNLAFVTEPKEKSGDKFS